MDLKRLVQSALQGNSDSEQYAILLVRVSIGLFFAISGANKLFAAGGQKAIYGTLVTAKMPFPSRWLISYRVLSALVGPCWPWVYFQVRLA
jgi:uncharacterized membrane protein YphA (DoxX/SURF4 family)